MKYTSYSISVRWRLFPPKKLSERVGTYIICQINVKHKISFFSGLKILVLETWKNQISVWVRNQVKIQVLKLEYSNQIFEFGYLLHKSSFVDSQLLPTATHLWELARPCWNLCGAFISFIKIGRQLTIPALTKGSGWTFLHLAGIIDFDGTTRWFCSEK